MTDRDVGEDGAVATEYLLVLTLIAVAIIATMLTFGINLTDAWDFGVAAVDAAL